MGRWSRSISSRHTCASAGSQAVPCAESLHRSLLCGRQDLSIPHASPDKRPAYPDVPLEEEPLCHALDRADLRGRATRVLARRCGARPCGFSRSAAPFLTVAPPPAVAGPCTHSGVLGMYATSSGCCVTLHRPLVQPGRNNTSCKHGAASAHRAIEKVGPLWC
jgi:hypothetical protein